MRVSVEKVVFSLGVFDECNFRVCFFFGASLFLLILMINNSMYFLFVYIRRYFVFI